MKKDRWKWLKAKCDDPYTDTESRLEILEFFTESLKPFKSSKDIKKWSKEFRRLCDEE